MISRNVTMAFSAEMAGTDGKHMLDVDNLQEDNGSVGVSPSATAYFATYISKGDEASLNYLRIGHEAGRRLAQCRPVRCVRDRMGIVEP